MTLGHAKMLRMERTFRLSLVTTISAFIKNNSVIAFLILQTLIGS